MHHSTFRQPMPQIFTEYSMEELHRRLHYTYSYLDELARGTKPIPRRFVHNACMLLGRSEEELFGPAEIPEC